MILRISMGTLRLGRMNPAQPSSSLVVWHGISVTYSTGGSGSEGAVGVFVAGDPLE